MAYQKYKNEEAVVFAPYNFISFPKNPVYVKDEKDIIGHDVMTEKTDNGDDLYSGEIHYTLEAMTPVFIDDGTEQHRFCMNAEGNHIIPGSTMRGLARSHALVLGLGNVRDDIDDYSLMYRNVASGLNRRRYNDILGATIVRMKDENEQEYSLSVLKNVRAGYIEKREDGSYVIYKTVLDPDEENTPAIDPNLGKMNYYTLSERKVIEQYLKKESEYRSNPDSFAFSFLIPGMQDKMMNMIQHFRKEYDRRGNASYRGKNNFSYQPYYKEVLYGLKGKRCIDSLKPIAEIRADASVLSRDGNYRKNFYRGMLVSTGYMQKKKVIYVIPEIDSPGNSETRRIAVEISERDVRDFKVDYNHRINSITLEKKNPNRINKRNVEEYKEYFALPEKVGEKGRKPVFYIQYGGRCYFGFTPRLRLFYDNTVADGIPGTHLQGKIDYVKAIFGYTKNPGEKGKKGASARKTRVSFSDAEQVTKGQPEDYQTVLPGRYLTLSEPRPTDCFNYLDQSNGESSYNSDHMQLRGTKQYWLHKEADPGIQPGRHNEKMDSLVNPLDRGTKFKGTIRFKNLREYELGLLIWSIRLEKDSWMNIGKGKAYGYGAMKLTEISAWKIDCSKAYSIYPANCSGLFDSLYDNLDVDELINIYKNHLRNYNGGRDISQIPYIRDFFAMKNSTLIPDSSTTGYMNLEEFQAQTRTKTSLPDVMDIIAKSSSLDKKDALSSQTVYGNQKNPGDILKTSPEAQSTVVFLAKYPLSESQKEKLVNLSGMNVIQIRVWPNDENIAKLSREYGGIALPPNAYPRLIEISKRFCNHVFQAIKQGDMDSDWKTLT